MSWPKFFESISVFESDSDLTADNVHGLRGCCYCIRSGYVLESGVFIQDQYPASFLSNKQVRFQNTLIYMYGNAVKTSMRKVCFGSDAITCFIFLIIWSAQSNSTQVVESLNWPINRLLANYTYFYCNEISILYNIVSILMNIVPN